jgi:hypothetical protein
MPPAWEPVATAPVRRYRPFRYFMHRWQRMLPFDYYVEPLPASADT